MYNYFADYAKKAAHIGIEYTFPRTGSIALISAATGWYAYQFSMTYSQGWLAELITQQFIKAHPLSGATVGFLIAPFFVPWIAPYFSGHISLGVSLTTSLSLNLLAQLTFGIKKIEEQPHKLPEALKKVNLPLETLLARQKSASNFSLISKSSLNDLSQPPPISKEGDEKNSVFALKKKRDEEESLQVEKKAPLIRKPSTFNSVDTRPFPKVSHQDILGEDPIYKGRCGIFC